MNTENDHILAHLRRWLHPPKFPDEEQTRLAATLNLCIGAVIGLVLINAVVLLVTTREVNITVWLSPVLILAALVLRRQMQHLIHQNSDLHRQIAEHQQKQDALQRDHRLMRIVIDHLPDYIYAKDRDGKFLLNNAESLRVLGVGRQEDIIGKTDFDFFPHDSAVAWRAREQALMDAGQPILDVEDYIAWGENQQRWVRSSTIPLRDEQGAVIGLVGITRDITQGIQAEKALRQSERRFAAVFHFSPIAITMTRISDKRYMDANPAYVELSGYSLEELLTTESHATTLWVDAQQRAAYEQLRQEQGGVRQFEFTFRKKSGQTGTALLSSQRITLDNEDYSLSFTMDITERKQIEDTLRSAEETFSKVFYANPVGVSLTRTSDGARIAANDAFLSMFGYTRDSMLRNPPSASVLWADADAFSEFMKLLATQQPIRLLEFAFRKQSGETGTALMSIERIELSGQAYNLSYVLDITERKRAQDAVQQQAKRLSILHEIDRAILAADSVSDIATCALRQIRDLIPCQWTNIDIFSPGGKERVRFTGDSNVVQVLSESVDERWLQEIMTSQTLVIQDLKAFSVSWPDLQALREQGCNSVLSSPLIVRDELLGVLNLMAVEPGAFTKDSIDMAAVVAGQMAIAVQQARLYDQLRRHADELERRVAERTQALQDSIAEAEQAHRETTILYGVSRAVNATTAYAPILQALVDEVGTFDFSIAFGIYPDYRYEGATYSNVLALLEAGSNHAIEVNQRMPLHLVQEIEPNMVLIEDMDDPGQVEPKEGAYYTELGIRALLSATIALGQREIGWLAFFSDKPRKFTDFERRIIRGVADLAAAAIERSRLFAEAQVAQKAAEDASRVKSQFLANMSHELRTPLYAILNFTAFVADGVFGSVNIEQAEALQQSVASGKHLLSLINDILDLTKIEVGQMDLFIQEVDLNEALAVTVSVAKGLIKDKPLDLILDIAPQLPVIFGDRRRIRQIFLNLVSNAIKFTPQGSLTISAHVEGNGVHLAIKDTGIGIAPEDQALVFESFKQARHELPETMGTGLGLPISRFFVEAHGGSLWLESEPGKGSTFHVLFPLRTQQEAEEAYRLASHAR